MRGLVVAGLVVFHSAMVFGTSWFVNAPRPTIGFSVFLLWGSLWGMPLLFLVSGMGVRYAMRSRTAQAFTAERLGRLGIPFATGLVLLVPPMFYLEHLAQPGFHQTYGRFWLAFWNIPAIAAGLLPHGHWTSGGVGFDPAHLRFLYVLLVFSPALLPLFCYLRGPRGTRLAGRAAEQAVRHPLAILAVAAVPVIVTEAVFGPDGITGGWERLAYLFPPVPSFIVSLRSTTWPTTSPAPVTTGVLTATPARREPQPTTQPPRSFTGACTISPRPGPASTPRSPSSTLMSASSSSWAVPDGTRSSTRSSLASDLAAWLPLRASTKARCSA